MSLLLRSHRLEVLQKDWDARFGQHSEFFDQDALLIDFTALDLPSEAGFAALLDFLHQRQLRPVACKGQAEGLRALADAAGLAWADEAVVSGRPAPNAAQAPAPVAAPVGPLLIDRPLRAGQQVYARGRDLIVTAMVNPGSEVVADGHIHVYAPLRGRAIAGARGDASARIFTQALEAELISIAGVYRTSDVPLPDNVWGKPAQIQLQGSADTERLVIQPLV
jgi:septum site-determining protein MinC